MYVIFALALALGLCACEEKGFEDAISGTEFDPDEYNLETIERYEHREYGIILEYPSGFERVGNFELDGYMTFEKDDTSIYVYVPDYDNNDVVFVEKYVKETLGLRGDKGSGVAKYGKSSGYKLVSNSGDKIRIDFVVKGIDAFYRFAYVTNAEGFTEEDETFRQVMESIRIDDGVYSKLTSMSSRYRVLFEYARMESPENYVNDVYYINHCLNSYETTNEARHKQEALTTCRNIIEKISEISGYNRNEDDIYEEEWQKVKKAAEEVLECCERIEKAINNGDYAYAQKIARSEVNYDLNRAADAYLSIINAEIAEY